MVFFFSLRFESRMTNTPRIYVPKSLDSFILVTTLDTPLFCSDDDDDGKSFPLHFLPFLSLFKKKKQKKENL